MEISVIITFVLCALISFAIMYTMYSRSSAPRLFSPQGPQVKETFKTEEAADEMYQNRLFVLKMYETLGKKPSSEELDRVASIGTKVEIMQYLVAEAERAESKKIEHFAENKIEDSDEIFGPIDDEAIILPVKPRQETPKETTPPPPPPQPSPEPAIVQQQQQLVSTTPATHRKGINDEHPAKKYVRDMFMLLGRIDAML